MLSVAALLLSGLVGAVVWTRAARVEIDQATLCPVGGPAAIRAVLIDRSDPITPQQQARVRQVLERVVADAPIGGLVSLYLAESDGVQALSPALSLCNPGNEANPIYQNPRRMRERYDKDFRDRVEDARERLLKPNPRTNSPIMESIKAVCIDAFGRARDGTLLSLTIVSDMLQNSPATNHYRDRDFDAFLRSPRLASVLTDCKRADVDIIYLLRPNPQRGAGPQTGAHQRFWDLYMQRLNARPRSLEAV